MAGKLEYIQLLGGVLADNSVNAVADAACHPREGPACQRSTMHHGYQMSACSVCSNSCHSTSSYIVHMHSFDSAMTCWFSPVILE